MGSNSKGFATLPVAVTIALVGVGLTGVAVASQMGVKVPMLSSVSDQPSTSGGGGTDSKTGQKGGGGDTPIELRQVKWENEYTVPLEMKLPVDSSVQADIFVSKPDKEGEYGDYVDYNRSDATSGMTQGVDYFHQDGSSVQSLTFDPGTSISPGTYKAAIVDNSSSGNKEYHDLFTTVTVPSKVEFNRYNDQTAKTIVPEKAFDRRAAYESDSYTLYKGSDTSNQVAFGDKDGTKDLATSAYGASDDETFTIKRTLDYKHGVDYLGKVDVTTVNGSANANVEADVTITANVRNDKGRLVEKTIFDQDVADDSEKAEFDEVINTAAGKDSTDSNPAIVGEELTVKATVKFDGSAVANGDTQFNATIKDIYGNNVGSDPFISLTT